MDKINAVLTPNRFIPIDSEELTALELIGKVVNKTNEVVDKTITQDEEIKKRLKIETFKDEMVKRKLDDNGDFTGSWFGIKSPSFANETQGAMIEKNREDIIKNKEELLSTLSLPNHTVYLSEPHSLYIYNSNYIGGVVDFSFKGSLVVTNKVSYEMDDLLTKFSNKVVTSYEGKKKCIRLADGEAFVYDEVIKDVTIKPFYGFDTRTQIPILYQVCGVISEGVFKEYYQSKITWESNVKYNTITENQKWGLQGSVQRALDKMDVKSHNTTFAFITDIHSQEWNKGYYSQGVSVINRLAKNSLIEFVVSGGDNILWAEQKGTAMMNLLMTPQRLEPPTYYGVGNHDYNGWDYDRPQNYGDLINDKEMYNILGKGMPKDVTWGNKEKMYYFMDKGDNLRIIVLNPLDIPIEVNHDNTVKYNHVNTFAYGNDQLYWLGNVLLGSTDKHVLVFTHIPLVGHDGGMYANYTLAYNGDVVGQMIGHFKTGTPFTFDKTHQDPSFNVSGSVEFSTPSKVVGVISGHIHYDCDVVKYGYRHIARNCDYPVKWDNTGLSASGGGVPVIPDREVGEWNHHSFDVITVDTWNRKVFFTKFGAGSDYWYAY